MPEAEGKGTCPQKTEGERKWPLKNPRRRQGNSASARGEKKRGRKHDPKRKPNTSCESAVKKKKGEGGENVGEKKPWRHKK